MIEQLTFVIPTRNRADVLRQSLEHMCMAGLGDEKYIVYDDASERPDETIRACASIPHAKVIRGAQRVGQAQGRNVLLSACTTSYAVLMDDDTWFTEAGALPGLVKAGLLYEGIGHASAVCSQVVRTTDGVTVFPKDAPTKRILSPLGMGCIVRKDDILRVGAFRAFFGYRHEETELGLRMWAKNHIVVYDPSLVLAHRHTPLVRSSSEYDRLSARNLILMHGLNCPGVHGIPLGVARALRLLLCNGISRGAVLTGCVDGLRTYIRHRNEATIMPPVKYRDMRQFARRADKYREGA